MHEMFIGPPEEDAEWTDAAVAGPARFLRRVWRLVLELESVPVTGAKASSAVLPRRTRKTIKRVTQD